MTMTKETIFLQQLFVSSILPAQPQILQLNSLYLQFLEKTSRSIKNILTCRPPTNHQDWFAIIDFEYEDTAITEMNSSDVMPSGVLPVEYLHHTIHEA